MYEQTAKKRAWVKDVAIVFLVILLILTFFSKTILDWSLPEVAVQTVTSGAITAQIRGTVTVKAAETYELKVPEGRRITATMVKLGEKVSKGDVLLLLSEEAAGDLSETEAALKEAQHAYQDLLLGDGTVFLTRAVEDAKAALSKAQAKAAERDKHQELLDAALQEVEAKKAAVTEAEAAIKAELQARKDAVKAQEAEIATLNALLKARQEELEAARRELAKIAKRVTGFLPAQSGETLDEEVVAELRELIAADSAAVKTAAVQLEIATEKYKSRYDEIVEEAENHIRRTPGYKALEAEFQNPVNLANAQRSYIAERLEEYILETVKEIDAGTNPLVIVPGTSIWNDSLEAYVPQVDMGKQILYKEAYENYTAAAQAYDKAVKQYEVLHGTVLTAYIAECEEGLKVAEEAEGKVTQAQEAIQKAQETKEQLEAAVTEAVNGETPAHEAKAAAEAALTEAQTAYETLKTTDYTGLDDQIKELKRNLEDAQRNYQKGAYDTSYALKEAKQRVDDLKAELAKKGKTEGGTEVKTEVDGIIRGLNIPASGGTTAAGATITIEVPERGYSGELSVPMEQAQRVNVGDAANVSTGWWRSQDIQARLAAIKTDPQNPRTNRLLVFQLTGADVESGANLTVSIGERSRTYDSVIPKSALRSDANGTYVLLVTAKSSPVGNRYTATRIDVNVLAQDDNNVAVSGGLGYNDYVITSATAPVDNGTQVRMAEH